MKIVGVITNKGSLWLFNLQILNLIMIPKCTNMMKNLHLLKMSIMRKYRQTIKGNDKFISGHISVILATCFYNIIKLNIYQIWKLLKVLIVMWYFQKKMIEDQSQLKTILNFLTFFSLFKLHLKIKQFLKIICSVMMKIHLLLKKYNTKFQQKSKKLRKDRVDFHWQSLKILLCLT